MNSLYCTCIKQPFGGRASLLMPRILGLKHVLLCSSYWKLWLKIPFLPKELILPFLYDRLIFYDHPSVGFCPLAVTGRHTQDSKQQIRDPETWVLSTALLLRPWMARGKLKPVSKNRTGMELKCVFSKIFFFPVLVISGVGSS